jgi:hypothetical protein
MISWRESEEMAVNSLYHPACLIFKQGDFMHTKLKVMAISTYFGNSCRLAPRSDREPHQVKLDERSTRGERPRLRGANGPGPPGQDGRRAAG